MPQDIASVVDLLMRDGSVRTLAMNAAAQFGIGPRRYLGAELLPERMVPENAYREEQIRYRTVLANDGTRYSPTQKKGAALFGTFLVELGNSDIASDFTSRDYDALIALLMNNMSMDAAVTLINWADRILNLALVEKNEVQRWEAIVNASVVRAGDNGYTETVAYSNPAGHRANIATAWSNTSVDPFNDIFTMADLLASKGYTVSRIITGRPVVSIMAANPNVKARTGIAVISSTGQIQGAIGRATLGAMNDALQSDGLPPIELYDLQYRTQTGTGYFLPRQTMVLVATTGRDETIDLGDSGSLFLQNTLGYVGIGRAAGQATPGRVIRMEAKESKPPRINGEAWQTSLPVVTEPEAVAVLKTIT
jgi:hypothetical protein